MSLKLYYFPVSPYCRLVNFILADGNIPVEIININLFAAEQNSEEYVRVNPNKTVPALVEDDLILWESHAIAKYLVDKHASVPDHWYPRNDRVLRAQIDQWLDWINNNYRPPHLVVLRPPVFKDQHHPDQAVHDFLVGVGRKKIDAALDHVDQHLAKTNTPFLVGSEITLADLSLHLQVLLLSLILDEKELINAAKRPHFAEWYSKVPKSVPHWEEINSVFFAARENAKNSK